jgi:hypothetical protein
MDRVELKNIWRVVFRTAPPDEQQWAIWERAHDGETLQSALLQTAVKQRSLGGEMSLDYQIRFCSAVANRLTKERLNAIAKLKGKPLQDTSTVTEGEINGNRI